MLPQKKYEGPDVFWKYFAPLNKKPSNDNEPENELERIADEEAEKNIPNLSLNVMYLDGYRQKRQNTDYETTIGAYLNRRQQALNDFSDRVPGKHVDIFPANMMGSVLGFTYLGQGYMALRDDLAGKTKRMVDIHESIHTPDEYETRILTDWIMSRPKNRYIR